MFYIGVDLGQKRDHSAIAIVEKPESPHPAGIPITIVPSPELLVRRVERIPLGTPYPEVVARIRSLAYERPLAGNCAFAIDATGVGAPVIDMLREPGMPDLTAVTISPAATMNPAAAISTTASPGRT